MQPHQSVSSTHPNLTLPPSSTVQGQGEWVGVIFIILAANEPRVFRRMDLRQSPADIKETVAAVYQSICFSLKFYVLLSLTLIV
ncbi:hypothetical protein CDAR_26861 [Caerostris darwini]|uniref:Uncharacterized protein n=1 Tax=Caerostris darwini TaxID=1538125 RepID=A0AAV4WW42_9ARAC|nr:hypothetical protein CDAR_26861 [Caerostris darwini]